MELLARIVGPVHALAVGLPALETLLDALSAGPSAPWPTPPGLQAAVAISIGYMLVDSAQLLLRYDGAMVIHHALTLCVEVPFVFDFYPTYMTTHVMTSVFMSTELSTPFLHCSFILNRYGLDRDSTGTRWSGPAFLSHLMTLVTWFFTRVFAFLWLGVALYCRREDLSAAWFTTTQPLWASRFKMIHVNIFYVLLTLLNLQWQYKLIRLFLRGPHKKGRKRQ
ncbi:uncharacterized protein MONBRDRAFT_24215 [Monosiga brevicollis MX1]|uniref:TLC domain-containing protein n=1 Tax=Monosiga brevicollis TaxID=81824 RepID=A9UVR4_MONBE|nr:uncharacterized protein MONBRDRAFT_24215 [Monosiga brevicollis MX1]EDQ90633.1 predicted protein [Monosiga brevicollis MX1]|eukprot:XP_001744684.1 hypothetical protein [Monosiga brevicollis MX1]